MAFNIKQLFLYYVYLKIPIKKTKQPRVSGIYFGNIFEMMHLFYVDIFAEVAVKIKLQNNKKKENVRDILGDFYLKWKSKEK